MAGAIWAGLVPTVIVLAIYFCFADFALIMQCLYYKFRNIRERSASSPFGDDASSEDPHQPLLRRSTDNMGLPGSRRRSSASRARQDLNSPIDEGSSRAMAKNALGVFLVCLAGTSGWFVAWQTGVWTAAPSEPKINALHTSAGAQILGYVSAVCYLGQV